MDIHTPTDHSTADEDTEPDNNVRKDRERHMLQQIQLEKT